MLTLRKAYEAIMVMIKNRDMAGLKQVTRISNEEMGAAEGASPEMMFVSSGFPQRVVNKELTLEPTVWEEYQLKTCCGGRMGRLSVGFYQNSPCVSWMLRERLFPPTTPTLPLLMKK